MKVLSKMIMTTNSIKTYDVFPSDTVSVRLEGPQKAKLIPLMVPFLITVMTMTATPYLEASNKSIFSQPVIVYQDSDFKKPAKEEAILKQFVTSMVSESIELEPEFAEIANKNFKRFLW